MQSIVSAIDKTAPINERHVKNGLMEKLSMKSKILLNYLKSVKKSKLHIDKDIHNVARYKVQKMNFSKKKFILEKKLTESLGKPKDLYKDLKGLGLAIKTSSCEIKLLKINNTVKYNVYLVLEDFKEHYSILGENLVKMLPRPPNKYSIY